MPGGKKDYKKVLKALKKGTISREQLEIKSTIVIKMVDNLCK